MALSKACLCLYATTYQLFSSGFCQKSQFSTGNAAQFGIRSDPFFEISLRILLSEVDMRTY
jgi:hypothetical protein